MNKTDNENVSDDHKNGINQLIEQTIETANLLYMGNYEQAQKSLNGILEGINNCYTTMMNNQQYYQKMGVIIPADILTAQYQNMAEALQCGDLLKLADTLFYEIKEGLEFFKNISKSCQE